MGQFMFFSHDSMPSWAFFSPEVQAMYGNYGGVASSYCSQVDCYSIYPDVKNLILRVAADWGPIAAIAALLFWAKLVWRLARRLRRRDDALDRFLIYALIPMPVISFGVSSYMWLHWIFALSLAAYVTGTNPPCTAGQEGSALC
jgi:hypothetical protein